MTIEVTKSQEKNTASTKNTKSNAFSWIGLASAAIIVSGLFTFILMKTFSNEAERKKSEYFMQAYRSRTELRFEGLRDSLVTVTDQYIQLTAPGSALNGLAVVNACEKYDIDLRFVLVQGLVESHFGTKGLSKRTNSVWNVGAYDKDTAETVIKKGYSYTHPDHSAEPYCKLLVTRYLKNATEEDLLIKFVDCDGHRYASNKQYETMLYDHYINIDKVVDFGVYQEYIKIKKLLGR